MEVEEAICPEKTNLGEPEFLIEEYDYVAIIRSSEYRFSKVRFNFETLFCRHREITWLHEYNLICWGILI